MSSYEYLLSDISTIKGIGTKIGKLFRKKNINTIFDLLWNLPRDFVDRSNVYPINELQVGKIQTVTVIVKKYNFPRIRNLPNKVICEDETGKLDCIFFNSYEGYIRKILPLNAKVTISGKIGYYNKKYQITNPTHLSEDPNSVKKIDKSYSLTEGLNNKLYNKIIQEVLRNLPNLDEWLDKEVLKKFDNISWKKSVLELHNPNNINKKGNFLERLIFDEILSTFLINSKIRKTIKKFKKERKKFDDNFLDSIKKKLDYELTTDQINALNEISNDLKSEEKMFRLLQGDVGSGKTIVALISCLNVVNSGYQVAFMAPTEILAYQHYKLAQSLLKDKIKIDFLSSKTDYSVRKNIIKDLQNNEIKILFGTHSIFQEKINYKKLGLIVIDEQHKFGVKQRKKLSDKGGKNCDVLVMSATPIPRTMIMTIFGDMDVTIIKQKPKNRKPVKTYSKVDTKLNEVIDFTKNQIKKGNQIFWVCPLIDESKKVDHQSAVQRYKGLQKIFKDRTGLLHGSLDKSDKDKILNKFLNKKIDILISTTVIEVGIDFPNANLIIIENSNKFGLSQLHQLRGRVGRGNKESFCILMFKNNLSKNARKRINILKENNDGFKISEEDMKLRGYGDLLGFKQSGVQSFRLADPVLNEDLFLLAEKEIKKIEKDNINLDKFQSLLKLYDRADILNDIV
ncbi:ATP-dependent DNA helicase RecG [Candidatus Pelagibacter communis]|uniref:ATP-dependent DNA helicase RecG n=1 Tax=Pelagibacter ubique TaxID=198252 RepID=UPI00094D232E|nr:ATP-dependent DNA helicase RecG [Candidatus Pelagibacter ubique]